MPSARDVRAQHRALLNDIVEQQDIHFVYTNIAHIPARVQRWRLRAYSLSRSLLLHQIRRSVFVRSGTDQLHEDGGAMFRS